MMYTSRVSVTKQDQLDLPAPHVISRELELLLLAILRK